MSTTPKTEQKATTIKTFAPDQVFVQEKEFMVQGILTTDEYDWANQIVLRQDKQQELVELIIKEMNLPKGSIYVMPNGNIEFNCFDPDYAFSCEQVNINYVKVIFGTMKHSWAATDIKVDSIKFKKK